MGKPILASAQESPSSIFWVSHHPHRLHLISNPQTSFHCSACERHASSSADLYFCVECNYALHPCMHLPQQINHSFDQNQALLLHPAHIFKCNACGKPGADFSYHGTLCAIDLHITCISLPINLNHHSHDHALTLTFSVPYTGNTFLCDICKQLGSNTWVYRCITCEFDAHLTCAAAIDISPHTPPTQTNNITTSLAPTQTNGGGQVVLNTFTEELRHGRLRDKVTVAVVIAVAGGIASGIAQAGAQALFQYICGSAQSSCPPVRPGCVLMGLLGGGGVATIDESDPFFGIWGSGGVAAIGESSNCDDGDGSDDGGHNGGDGDCSDEDTAALRNLDNAVRFLQIDDECVLCHEQGHTRSRCPNREI